MVISPTLSLLINIECQHEKYDKNLLWFSMWKVCLFLLWFGVLLDEGHVQFWIKIKFLSYVNFDERFFCPMRLYLPRKCMFWSTCYSKDWNILATLLVHFTIWKIKNVPVYSISFMLHALFSDFKSLFCWNQYKWFYFFKLYSLSKLPSPVLDINMSEDYHYEKLPVIMANRNLFSNLDICYFFVLLCVMLLWGCLSSP